MHPDRRQIGHGFLDRASDKRSDRTHKRGSRVRHANKIQTSSPCLRTENAARFKTLPEVLRTGPPSDDWVQSDRFISKAREIGAEATPKMFEEVFRRVALGQSKEDENDEGDAGLRAPLFGPLAKPRGLWKMPCKCSAVVGQGGAQGTRLAQASGPQARPSSARLRREARDQISLFAHAATISVR